MPSILFERCPELLDLYLTEMLEKIRSP
jgi:hypothetical protein